jgi:uncharacterized pyridoxamine 5'-phosphate oxidase family protein
MAQTNGTDEHLTTNGNPAENGEEVGNKGPLDGAPREGSATEPPLADRLQQVVGYLTSVPAWFLATSVEGEPHVRPFSFAAAEDGRLWLSTSKGKDVYDELLANPRFELSAWAPGRPWLIVHGTAVFAEPSASLRQAGFEHMLGLGEKHQSADDGLLTFFFIDEAAVRICDITGTEQRFSL